MTAPEPPARRWTAASASALAGALALGIAIRLQGLARQVLIGDELHTLNGAIARPLGEILTTWTWGGADYCVPLTAFFRAIHAMGAPLPELVLRAPSLAAGALAIVAFPLALRARIGRAPAVALGFLIATSPLLAVYARIVRSYAVVVLLGGLAVLAFERFWRTRDRRFAAAWAALAPLACWFHLVMGPFVAAPLAWAAIDLARSPAKRARARELAAVAGAAALLLALLLGPAAPSILALTSTHRVGEAPSLATWWDVARMHGGSLAPALTALFLALGARGGFLLWRRDRAFAGLLACTGVAHVAGLYAMSPDQLQHGWVLNRYLLPLLPFELALVALGCTAPHALPARARRIATPIAAAALVAALFATGPLAGPRFRAGSFVHSIPSVSFTSEGNRIPRDRMPPFYQRLADAPGGRPIVEFPWNNLGSHAFEAYQHWHGRDVLVASMDGAHGDPSLGLRNVVAATPEAFLASGAQYVVVHLDLRLEESLVPTSDGHHWRRLGALGDMWERAQRLGRQMARLLEQRFGPPAFANDQVRVWDLDAVRAARAGAARGGARQESSSRMPSPTATAANTAFSTRGASRAESSGASRAPNTAPRST
ncbi:MAG: hypothetical protein KC560_10060, partial [Myxococcales bacterium]|nr:hypothetical protein [Myxococcales bacterium]